jgi:hypothetical protein
VENNLITLVPQQGAFIVNGQKGKYCVTLFPKETCQCVTTSTCYHIWAAEMSIGFTVLSSLIFTDAISVLTGVFSTIFCLLSEGVY